MVYPFVIMALLLSVCTIYFGGFAGLSAVLFGILFFVLYFVGAFLLFCLALFVMSLTVNMDEPQERDSRFFRAMRRCCRIVAAI